MPSRGVAAAQSREIQAAIALAVQQRGGRAGSLNVEYLPLDDGSDETGEWSRNQEMENANRAANDPSVMAYIGPYNSGAASISLPISNRTGLLQASPSVTWPGLTLAGWDTGEPDIYFPTASRTFVRLMPPDSVEAEVAARWATSLGFRKMALLQDGSSYSIGMAKAFEKAAAMQGIETTPIQKIDVRSEDIRLGQLSNQIALFYAPSSVGNAVLVAKATMGQTSAVFATDTALDPKFVDQAGAAGRNWRIISNSAGEDSEPKALTQASPSKINMPPGQFAANAYMITNLVLDAMAAHGANRKDVMNTVMSAREGGKPLFDQNGDPTNWIVSGYSWANGRFAFEKAFTSER